MCDTSFLHKSPTEQRTSKMFYYTAAEQLYCAQSYIITALGGEVHRIFFLCPVILHASRTAIVYGHCLNSVIFLQASPCSSEKILTNKRMRTLGKQSGLQGKLLLATLHLGEQIGPVVPSGWGATAKQSKAGRAVAPSPSARSQLPLCWPSAPAAKLRGLASAVSCVLLPTQEEHLLVVWRCDYTAVHWVVLCDGFRCATATAVCCPTIMTGKANSR